MDEPTDGQIQIHETLTQGEMGVTRILFMFYCKEIFYCKRSFIAPVLSKEFLDIQATIE